MCVSFLSLNHENRMFPPVRCSSCEAHGFWVDERTPSNATRKSGFPFRGVEKVALYAALVRVPVLALTVSVSAPPKRFRRTALV